MHILNSFSIYVLPPLWTINEACFSQTVLDSFLNYI